MNLVCIVSVAGSFLAGRVPGADVAGAESDAGRAAADWHDPEFDERETGGLELTAEDRDSADVLIGDH
jgi:hypothetical protein